MATSTGERLKVPLTWQIQTDTGPAVWFQVVPEAKLAKNRIHLDIQAAPGEHEQLINELTGLGGTVLADCPRFTTLADPERNELCITRS